MLLTARCKQDFSAATRRKGESYFRRGNVKVVEESDSNFRAAVRGSSRSPYTVELDWSDPDDGILATCTCPHYEGGSFCKHLWATILTADQRGVGVDLLGGPELVHSYDDEYEEFHYDEFGLVLSRALLQGSANRAQSGRGAKKPAKPPAWHSQLAQYATINGDAFEANPFRRLQSRPKRAQFIVEVASSFHAGAVVINLFQQEMRKDGQWGKLKPLKTSRNKLSEFSPTDQRQIELALGNYTGTPWNYGSHVPLHEQFYQQVSQVELVPATHELLLPELCAENRLSWVLSGDQPVEDSRPLVWDEGPPWEFRLVIDENAKQKAWTVRGELVQGNRVIPLAEPVMLLSSGLMLLADSLARLNSPADWRWVSLLRSADQLSVPYADRQKLLAELWSAGQARGARLPENLQLQPEIAAPVGCLRIHSPKEKSHHSRGLNQQLLYADVHFDYADQRVSLNDPKSTVLGQDTDRVILRDSATENNLLTVLAEQNITPRKPTYYDKTPADVQFNAQQFNKIVEHLTNLGWLVQAEGRLVKRAGEFRATIVSGVDWFDLETQIDFDGSTATLPQLLAALQKNERFVQLGDGSQGMLPQEWLERYGSLAEFAEIDGDRLRFRSSQALLLDALLGERSAEMEVQVDRQFSRLRDKLRSFDGVKPRQAPRGFRGELRPYQKEGLGWIAFLEEFGLNGCLADDMGLGKTVQVLAWLVARSRRRGDIRPTLIVAPKSVVFNWQLEAERFAPKLKVLNYTGIDRAQRIEEISTVNVVLTTYGTLRKDIEILKDVSFDYVILDEAQAIKNDKSISAKVCRLLQADHRLALTGTPVENHLGDLWSLFEFLNPGMLGRSTALRSYARGNGEDQTSLDTLRRGLAPFILRRTKEQVLKDLPKKNEQTLLVELLPADRKRYNDLRDHYRRSLLPKIDKSGMNSARMHVLEALLRLRQAACHTGLVDKNLVGKPSAKLETLVEQATEVVAEGHKALIFSQFTSLLSIVKTSLDGDGLTYEYLDGRTRNRQERVERFQNDPACSLFLISLKAGGTGLNLTAADYVFLLDPWWNPAVEAQAIDRAHRIGQQRPVFAYRLVAKDTVEEKIIELQLKKRELADAIISGNKSLLGGLSLEDLQLLLT